LFEIARGLTLRANWGTLDMTPDTGRPVEPSREAGRLWFLIIASATIWLCVFAVMLTNSIVASAQSLFSVHATYPAP